MYTEKILHPSKKHRGLDPPQGQEQSNSQEAGPFMTQGLESIMGIEKGNEPLKMPRFSPKK